MGINCGNLLLLKTLASRGPAGDPLGDLLMFGRQHSTISRAEQARLSSRFRIPMEALADRYSENLLRAVGAKTVTSIDVSDYERCDIVLDLMEDVARRQDLAERLCERFDTVLDYGTSEHVFNYPQALVNTWNMLRENGRYVFDLPVTGWTNHGMVQFTPSYFYSVGRTPFFFLEHIFFHGRRGARIFDLADFDSKITRALYLRGKINAWGVMRKRRPPDQTGPLALERLRIMQVELHSGPVNAEGRNRAYNANTIVDGFRRQAEHRIA